MEDQTSPPTHNCNDNHTSGRSNDTLPPAENQPLPRDKFSFLKELTGSKHHHGNKTFYQHLFSVYSYLQSQSLPEEVCDAGLFHAIYGTEFYSFQSSAITRDIVRGYIGEYGEELVHIFCGLRKGRFGAIVNNTGGWSVQQHLDLCRLEHANFWDGRDFRNFENQMAVLSQKIAQLQSEMPAHSEDRLDRRAPSTVEPGDWM